MVRKMYRQPDENFTVKISSCGEGKYKYAFTEWNWLVEIELLKGVDIFNWEYPPGVFSSEKPKILKPLIFSI